MPLGMLGSGLLQSGHLDRRSNRSSTYRGPFPTPLGMPRIDPGSSHMQSKCSSTEGWWRTGAMLCMTAGGELLKLDPVCLADRMPRSRGF